MATTTQPLRRVSNWPAVLAAWIEEKRPQPFDWVRNNCCFFACDWIYAATGGADVAANYRKRVKSTRSAVSLLKRGGGAEAIAAKVCARHGWAEVQVARAQRGDIVSVDTEHGPALGVCIGGLVAFAGFDRMAFRKLGECRRAWRVG